MKNSNKVVESISSPALSIVKPLFKYTVGFPGADDINFASDSLQDVSHFLLEDPEVVRLGEADYLANLEGPYIQDAADDHVWENIEEFAAQAGYEIKKHGVSK